MIYQAKTRLLVPSLCDLYPGDCFDANDFPEDLVFLWETSGIIAIYGYEIDAKKLVKPVLPAVEVKPSRAKKAKK